jgi:hypothetical protein
LYGGFPEYFSERNGRWHGVITVLFGWSVRTNVEVEGGMVDLLL